MLSSNPKKSGRCSRITKEHRPDCSVPDWHHAGLASAPAPPTSERRRITVIDRRVLDGRLVVIRIIRLHRRPRRSSRLNDNVWFREPAQVATEVVIAQASLVAERLEVAFAVADD